MSNSDADTLPTLETIAELIKGFQQDVNARFDRLEAKVDRLEKGMEEIQLEIMSLDVRQNRLISQMYDARADVKALTAEMRTKAKDVFGVKPELGRL